MDIEPRDVFQYFAEISAIPRGSKNEQAVSDYITAFARERGLWVHQDAHFNVIIRKPASPGYEAAPTVILQGHMDMVCEKNRNVNHDFTNDGIKLIVDGDFLKADGTTLGADNGIAVAMCMALLNDNSLKHPALEILITSDEESGMTGARNLDPKLLTGRMLINLDSEGEGVFTASCAGGMDVKLHVPVEFIDVPNGYISCLLTVSGLNGGHSGSDIHKELANSNKILSRALYILEEFDCRLAGIWGGAKINAIPREAEAKLVVNATDYEAVRDAIERLNTTLKKEYRESDPGISLTLTRTEQTFEKALSKECGLKVLLTGRLLPNGVQHMCMSEKLAGIVETSTNLGVVDMTDGHVVFRSSLRSSVISRKLELADRIRLTAEALGIRYEGGTGYPAWEFDTDSKLQSFFIEQYKEYTGSDAELIALHAGLECGLFAEILDAPDMISLGPNMYCVHTPDERLSISSTARTWGFLKLILEKMTEI